jgi:hypothetical protein
MIHRDSKISWLRDDPRTAHLGDGNGSSEFCRPRSGLLKLDGIFVRALEYTVDDVCTVEDARDRQNAITARPRG